MALAIVIGTAAIGGITGSITQTVEATSQGQAIVDAAASQAGVAYCWDGGNTSGPTHGSGDLGNGGCGTGVVGFDCSGLALYAVFQATGITLPHGHGMESATGGQQIAKADLQPGDLVFFGGGSLANFEHVGVYAGSGKMWHAPDFNIPVRQDTLAWEENALKFDGGVRYWSGSGGSTAAPLHISAIHTGGGAEAKEGGLSAGWATLSSNGASQVIEDGTLNGLVYNGQLLVNQGHPTNNWIVEDGSGSVVSASITDAVGTTPARIGLLRNDGTFWVRDGLYGTWVQQTGSVATGYVSGNRVAVLLTNGQLWAKDGMYSNAWVLEQGGVTNAALSGDASTNGLIGAILTDGTYEVKQGGLGAGWVTEQGAAVKAQLSNATSQTPIRIGYIDTAGNFWAKEGISGGWVLEQGGVTNAALSGNLIGVVLSDGTYEVKQGGLGAGWITEDGLITQIALWSPN